MPRQHHMREAAVANATDQLKVCKSCLQPAERQVKRACQNFGRRDMGAQQRQQFLLAGQQSGGGGGGVAGGGRTAGRGAPLGAQVGGLSPPRALAVRPGARLGARAAAHLGALASKSPLIASPLGCSLLRCLVACPRFREAGGTGRTGVGRGSPEARHRTVGQVVGQN